MLGFFRWRSGLAVKQLWAPWRLEYIQRPTSRRAASSAARATVTTKKVSSCTAEELASSLLNKYPYASGHLMVAPDRHDGEFGELEADEALEIHRLAAAAARRPGRDHAARRDSTWAGTSGRIAGAGVVDHVHLHVVPRWAGDTNFMPVLADVKVLPGGARRQSAEARRGVAA